MEVYFDNAATTVVCPEAAEEMIRAMREDYGNPSSIHSLGRRAAKIVYDARGSVAKAIGAEGREIVFTSGGTEADNWAVLGSCRTSARHDKRRKHILTSAVEHDAVTEPIKKLKEEGWEVTYLPPDSAGRITPEAFAEALREDTVFASVMLVNNETGAINPIEEFSKEIRRRGTGTVLHTDAVQGFCKIPISVKSLGADLVSVSAHKIHGPKGIGALYIKDGIRLAPLILGGGQEAGKRSGTENVPAIAGFGAAARIGKDGLGEAAAKIQKLREYTVSRLMSELPDTVIIGGEGSPYILAVALEGYRSDALMSSLDIEGVKVARSAACKKGARSRTLQAMRLKNGVIDGALRVSFSNYSTREEAEFFVNALKKAAARLIKT